MTLCEKCVHGDICADRDCMDADDERALKSCSDFINKADFVEVVRCLECKKWKINPNNLYGGYCRYCEGASIDHFCSYGERK